MKVEISVAEVIQVFKELQEQPEKILEMVKADMPQAVGGYLSEIMRLELTRFLGRQPYERVDEESNHRNGSYERSFTLNGILDFQTFGNSFFAVSIAPFVHLNCWALRAFISEGNSAGVVMSLK